MARLSGQGHVDGTGLRIADHSDIDTAQAGISALMPDRGGAEGISSAALWSG